jgi:hypothetical protein
MDAELQANDYKGDWSKQSDDESLLQIIYHAAKLIVAIDEDHTDAIREFTADVANESLILADNVGVIDLPPHEEPNWIDTVLGIEKYDADTQDSLSVALQMATERFLDDVRRIVRDAKRSRAEYRA